MFELDVSRTCVWTKIASLINSLHQLSSCSFKGAAISRQIQGVLSPIDQIKADRPYRATPPNLLTRCKGEER